MLGAAASSYSLTNRVERNLRMSSRKSLPTLGIPMFQNVRGIESKVTPMIDLKSRSVNLGGVCSLVLYEASVAALEKYRS